MQVEAEGWVRDRCDLDPRPAKEKAAMCDGVNDSLAPSLDEGVGGRKWVTTVLLPEGDSGS